MLASAILLYVQDVRLRPEALPITPCQVGIQYPLSFQEIPEPAFGDVNKVTGECVQKGDLYFLIELADPFVHVLRNGSRQHRQRHYRKRLKKQD